MKWVNRDDMSFADSGAVVVQTDEGWEAYPFGMDGGSAGFHPSREQAMAAAEQVAISTLCCSGDGGCEDGPCEVE
ncbi:MAG: hypothetical protein HQL37_11020 [Alphaproteobacteria bacterium]|nr:hypothetical protein [Alphaproteobacteria bacterium]